jgi:hypothetical protein
MTKVLVLGARRADCPPGRADAGRWTEVSRKSVAALVTDIAMSPGLWSHANLGVNKPGTDGDRPSFS